MRGAVKKFSSLLLPKRYCFVVGVISRKYQPEKFFYEIEVARFTWATNPCAMGIYSNFLFLRFRILSADDD